MLEIEKKIQMVEKKIDEENHKLAKAEEQCVLSKKNIREYKTDLKKLIKLKQKAEEFEKKLQDSLSEFS